MAVFNQRLQQLHEMVHGLVSERAIVRLARFIQSAAGESNAEVSEQGACLRLQLSYYEIARSIGITYEECVRLFKQLQAVLSYSRGGKITILDWAGLDAIAHGTVELDAIGAKQADKISANKISANKTSANKTSALNN